MANSWTDWTACGDPFPTVCFTESRPRRKHEHRGLGAAMTAVEHFASICRAECCASFPGGDAFDQRHKLPLNRLTFYSRIRAKQSQGKTAVEKKQALHFALALVRALPGVFIVKEKRHRYIKEGRNLLQASSANAISAPFVFLYLLETDAEMVSKVRLRKFLLETAQFETPAKLSIVLAA
jgi:hypothetical protein